MRFAEKVHAGAETARAGVLPAKKQVCFVAPHAWPVLSRDPHIQETGGAEVQQSILARQFAAHGTRDSMITLDYGQPDRVTVDGVTVHKTFKLEEGVPVLRFVHPRLSSMWRALRAVDADYYYFRSAGMWLWFINRFCRRHGKHSIYAGASDKDFVPDIGGQMRYARDRWLYRRGLAEVDGIVAQNEYQRETCRATYRREATVIPSCYERPAARSTTAGRAAERDCVLWVAMMQPNKRPELFLELAARLPQRRFVMIGGPRPGCDALFEQIRAQAAKLPNLEFKGFQPLAEVEPWFDRARVFVNTSAFEGMPNTFLQAWSRGVPTLATVDVGAPSAYTLFQDTGTAAAEVERLFTDELHWRARSNACRSYFDGKYAPESVLAQYQAFFRGLGA